MRGTGLKFAKMGAARAAMAVALSTGLAAGGLVLGAAPAFAKEKEAPKAAYSKEFVAVAGPVQKLIEAAVAAQAKGTPAADLKASLSGAPATLATAEAAASTGQDKLAVGQWAVQIGGWLEDNTIRSRGIRNMLASGQLEAAKVPLFNFYLGNFAYAAKDWPTATEALTKAVSANYSEDAAAEMLADAYAEQGKNVEALGALKMAVDARKAANGAVPEAWFKRANLIAYKGKLGPQAIEWSTMLVQASPSPLNWLGAGQLTREFGNFTKEESLDLGRLFLRSGALNSDKQYVEREFIEYIESADPRRLPGETLKIAELGVSKGVLRANDMFVSDAISQSKGRIAADKASLAALERDSKAAATGKTALATADAYLSYDDPAKAEEFYKLAITKGSIDNDRALTRLGIAQSDQNKFDEAKATFAQVTGVRAPLAKLWSVYTADKAKP
jgi:tetratricopeptide (TPR) repeat protein